MKSYSLQFKAIKSFSEREYRKSKGATRGGPVELRLIDFLNIKDVAEECLLEFCSYGSN